MNIIFKFFLYASIILLLNTTSSDNGQVQASSDDNTSSYSQTNSITHQQTKAQVNLFREALDKFGATSPEQVISIWVNAEETRNGVFHYAVACEDLKERIIKEWGEPEDTYWIYGGSSPWLDKYEIVYNKKLSDSEYEVKIRFFWGTSSGPSKPSENTLLIIKDKDIWCVKEVK